MTTLTEREAAMARATGEKIKERDSALAKAVAETVRPWVEKRLAEMKGEILGSLAEEFRGLKEAILEQPRPHFQVPESAVNVAAPDLSKLDAVLDEIKALAKTISEKEAPTPQIRVDMSGFDGKLAALYETVRVLAARPMPQIPAPVLPQVLVTVKTPARERVPERDTNGDILRVIEKDIEEPC